MGQHAILSPSGAEKWMNCAGAPAMEIGLPDSSSEYSDEGTAAHLLGSTCLERCEHPAAYLGSRILVGVNEAAGFDGALWENEEDPLHEGFVIRRDYTVDDDMAEHVAKYVDRVRQYAGKDGILQAEQRISISHLTGEEGAAGTSDAAIVTDGELQVHDLKYGMGHRVSAERNKQLMIYALGVYEQMDVAYGPFKRVRLVIHQPRLDSLSEWDCSIEELIAFGEEVKGRARLALALHRAPEDRGIKVAPYESLNPSEDACRWCKAKATCPALAAKVQDALGAEFEALPNMVPPATARYDLEELGRKMAAIPLIEDWAKAIRALVEAKTFAGEKVPGWKLVMGKRGNRAWTDEEKVEALLKDMRITVEDRCNLKLKTPTQIEKFLKATPKRLNRLLKANLIGQADGKPSVAPESDPRPVYVAPDKANDFEAVEPQPTEDPLA